MISLGSFCRPPDERIVASGIWESSRESAHISDRGVAFRCVRSGPAILTPDLFRFVCGWLHLQLWGYCVYAGRRWSRERIEQSMKKRWISLLLLLSVSATWNYNCILYLYLSIPHTPTHITHAHIFKRTLYLVMVLFVCYFVFRLMSRPS